MAWVFINAATGRSTIADAQTGTTTSASMTGADTLFLIVTNAESASGDPVITDNVGGNTWVEVIQTTNAGATHCRIFRAASAAVSGSMAVTATTTGENSYFGLILLGFSGGHASPDNLTANNTGDAVTSLAVSSPLTPSENNCLVVAGISFARTSGSNSIDGGFAATEILGVSSESFGAAGAYLIQTTATAAQPTWSWSGSDDAATNLASFKSAAGGGGAPGPVVRTVSFNYQRIQY